MEQGLADYRNAISKVDRIKEGYSAPITKTPRLHKPFFFFFACSDTSEIQVSTKELGNFVTTIPELRERIKKLEAHTNIAWMLLEQIKARQLDNFYALEEARR